MIRLTVALLLGVLLQQTFADEPEAIVGGTPAAPGEFQYQCSMNSNGQHFCGCSILSATKILTAAHCVEGVSASQVRIHTGSIDSQGGIKSAVKSIVSHPNYRPGPNTAWENDVAVVTLQNPIQLNNGVQKAVTLPTNGPQDNAPCTLSGWGMIRHKGPLSRQLLKMNSALVNREQCKRDLRLPNLTSSHVCAFSRWGVGACQGDSGGPLVCNGVQYGITSFVIPCAQGYPDVYASVHHNLGFIRQQMARP